MSNVVLMKANQQMTKRSPDQTKSYLIKRQNAEENAIINHREHTPPDYSTNTPTIVRILLTL